MHKIIFLPKEQPLHYKKRLSIKIPYMSTYAKAPRNRVDPGRFGKKRGEV